MSPERIEQLRVLPWRGNCRELRNYVERCLVLSGESEAVADEPSSARPQGRRQAAVTSAVIDMELDFKTAKNACIEQFEREYVSFRLRQAEGNISRAAREMEIDRAYLVRLMRQYGMK